MCFILVKLGAKMLISGWNDGQIADILGLIADKSADFYRTDVILPILFRRLLLYKNEVNSYNYNSKKLPYTFSSILIPMRKNTHYNENFFSLQWEYTLVRISWNGSLPYRKRANFNSKPNMNACLLPTIFTWLHPELFLEQWTEILRVDKSGFGGDIGYAFTFFQQFGSFL